MSKIDLFRPKAVIFDMDGLMFDTENLTIPFWDIAGKKFGYNIPPEIVLKTVGISAARSRVIMLEEYGDNFPYDDIRGEFRQIVINDIEKNGVPKKPGLDYLLDRLSAAKIPFGLATSSLRETALFMLERAGVLDKFAAVTGGDEVENGKPAPDIFLKAAEKLRCSPSDCVGFEDSPAGLRGLHAAGIKSIFIKDNLEPPPEVLETVWLRCRDLQEAAGFLDIRDFNLKKNGLFIIS
ncbi:MAG: HAD family phosphatase [Treponema sp.]|jgi:HAD superfamily hydrolase (TIGR01509 family)|nr:HAD family phosphatase [Treponema sp.]